MKRSNVLFYLVGAVGLAGLLSACGSDEAPPVSASASGSGSASASGTVTGFGSLFVNGKRFETENVEVRHDGVTERCSINPTTTCGLKKGMTVRVNGSFSGNQHSASSVQQKDAVEGLVQSVAVDGLSLVVMGQTVLVDNTTIFDNNFTPVAGQSVEVNGHIRPNGIIQATFVEPKLAGITPEVRGYVSNHVAGSSTFRIGNLTVNYSGADISDMPAPNSNNWDGRFVEVKGAAGSFVPGPNNQTEGTLTASKVEPENEGVGNVVDEFEVEGFVTNVVSVDVNTRAAEFFIGTTRVQTNSNTEFRGGTVDEIVVGAKMSAEGRFDGSTLIAKHVKFHASVKLEGNATVAGNTVTLAGLPGVTITVNSQTELKDGGNTITVSDLNGNHVRVRGRVSGSSSVIATSIELRSPDNDVDLQGPVQDDPVVVPNLTILGVTVDTNGIQFEGVNDEPISQAAFFAAVQVGTVVKVKGRLVGGVVQWREAELED